MEDRWNAFAPYPYAEVACATTGPLCGLRLAVKDLFDVAGYPTAAGNAMLLASSGIKTKTAPLVQTLLDAGADFVGKANTDELAYSLLGNNVHFGMPVNPRDPGAIPGGSSSGSAVAVAADLADIGLGTDTSGSIRLPAAIQGLVGWRPTHGSLRTEGLRPLAPSFDVPSFVTAHLDAMTAVMDAVRLPSVQARSSSIVIAEDILQSVDASIADGILTILQTTGQHIQTIRSIASASLNDLATAFVTILQSEAWETNEAFFKKHGATIAPDIAARLVAGSRLDATDVQEARRIRSKFRNETSHLLADSKILALPTLAMKAPPRDATAGQFDTFRSANIRLLCLAGLGGYPQLAFPVFNASQSFSLSLVGAVGADRSLVVMANRIFGRRTYENSCRKAPM
ncbi:amidase family protein [Agrobacterium sp. rho-8.1]|nr:amidase family protein [Agrobacterium sp. rho-8.1]